MERRSLKIFSSKSPRAFSDEIRTTFKKSHLTYFILNLAFFFLTQCTHLPRENDRRPALQEALFNEEESDQLDHRHDEFAYFINRFFEISSNSKNLDYSRQELIIAQEAPLQNSKEKSGNLLTQYRLKRPIYPCI